MRVVIVALLVGGMTPAIMAADPWADRVISYNPGLGAGTYTNPSTALGQPTRFTGVGVFPGAVTPFNPAWMETELVSIGGGGHLTLAFDEPVLNNPANPYGIDLLIFGNAGFIDIDYPNGIVGGLFGQSGAARVELSSDGQVWVTATGIAPDRLFPTLGYLDLTDPYSVAPGNVLSDFTRPVDPAFDPMGKTFAQIIAGYKGSGGGAGVDIGAFGLGSVSFVRFTNLSSNPAAFQIDALAAVAPTPGVLALLGMFAGSGLRRRRCL
jgi:hypothetical protein